MPASTRDGHTGRDAARQEKPLRMRRLLALGASGALLATGLLGIAPSAQATVDCNPGGSGTGTLSDPYIVTTAVQLAAIDDAPSCMAANYVQTADITLTGPWTPLGASPAVDFSGVYHGGCKVIDGLTIGTQGSPYNGDSGLFRRADGATLRNMILTNVSVNSSGSNGDAGLVGYLNNLPVLIAQVDVSGSVTGNTYVGLIVGDDYESGSVLSQIRTSGSVTAVGQNGGAGGVAGYGTTTELSTSDATVTADIAGGLIGLNYAGSMTDVSALGPVIGTPPPAGSAGGLVGRAWGNITITSSFAVGSVTTGTVDDSSGLVGSVRSGNSVTNTDSYWNTTTTGQAQSVLSNPGGAQASVFTTTGAKDDTQMKTASTFTTWYPAVWNVTNGNYPTLKWIDAGGVPATCPQVTSVSPSSGAAGDQVTISGVGFTGATNVTFGGVAATNVTIVDDTTMTATVPAGSGSVAVAFQPAGAPVGTSGLATISLPVASKASAFTFGSSPGPAPTPVFPPSAPRDVAALPGDRSVFVSWREPASAGSFPVSTYKAIASPGGASCLTVAPSLTCTVAGLTNGTAYTFTVEALNGAGWSPAGGPSAPVTPGGVTPAPQPVPIPTPLAPGDSLLQTNGAVDPNVTVDANTSTNGLVISGDGWRMDLDGLGPDGKPLSLGPDGSLHLANERDVATEGSGFLPNSEVDLYVDPPVQATGATTRAGTRAEAGIYVGTVRTDASGNFTGTATLPEDITPGDHVLQAVGYSPTRQSRAMSLGVVVEQWIVLDKGSRKPAGVHDRMRTTGTTGGIDAGTKLTPHIKYAGQSSFSTGVATITVQADGSFTWSRLIRKDRGLTAYVSYVDTESNRVVWTRVR